MMSKRRGAVKYSPTTTILITIILIIAYTYYRSPSRHIASPRSTRVEVAMGSMTCNVISVTDGDTFKCRLSKGKEESIRLIGVDTPESKINEKAKRDAERSGQDLGTIVSFGKKAANFTKSYLKQGTTVKLELDVQPMDKHGRILAYAYLPDGTMINALLVQEGYAQVMTVPPNVKYHDMFLKLQREARENNRGLWKQ
jgi:micrococcal nuclease